MVDGCGCMVGVWCRGSGWWAGREMWMTEEVFTGGGVYLEPKWKGTQLKKKWLWDSGDGGDSCVNADGD